MRLGLGPVFAYEWLITTRRWQLYAMRTGFAGAILVGMMMAWRAVNPPTNARQTVSIQRHATYGASLYRTIVAIELSLVLLAAPAATAGAICLDNARGTLDHMLTTDLSNGEIVLGKLGVRLAPVLGLIACVLPITALASLVGGIDPTALLGSFLTAIGCALLGCSLALTLSVWGRKTHEVLMLTYLLLIFWLISPALLEVVADVFGLALPPTSGVSALAWIAYTNPYYLAFAPYLSPGRVGVTTFLAFLGFCLAGSTILLGLATRRIRAVALRQSGRPAASARPRRHFPRISLWPALPGPSLDGNPILWREWHRSKPSRLLRVAWMLYTALGLFWIVVSFKVAVSSPANQEAIALMSAFQLALGLLLLSVNAATGLADERAQGSLDVLLCTPLSTRSILVGKWWGSFRQMTPVLVWPAILAGILVVQSGNWISYLLLLGLITANCAVITSLGLAVATWVSRIGRAVALSISAFVVFSIGWIVVVVLISFAIGVGDRFALPLGMWSPLYGTLCATIAVAPGKLHLGHGVSQNTIALAAFFWTFIDAMVAMALFGMTLGTFDHCLGRVSEGTARPRPGRKLAAAPDAELDRWFGQSPAETSGPVRR